VYNLHKNTILYVTLHSRKVITIEERKQLETTWGTAIKLPMFSGDMSLVRRWWLSPWPFKMKRSINHLKYMVLCETNTGPCIFSLCYFLEMPFFIFDLLSSTPFATDNISRRMKSTWSCSAPAILHVVSEKAAETIWSALITVSKCQNTFNFCDYLVIFRHYFTGDEKMSCILTTISDWFCNIKLLCFVFSYRTKHESPAGDQFWKFSHQC